jgi:hypothetical protein
MKKILLLLFVLSIVETSIVSCKKENNKKRTVTSNLIPFVTLSQGRYWISVASAGNKIVFAGGHKTDSYWEPSSRVDIYDMITQKWTTAELSVPRYGMATVVAGNKIFFAGGAIYDDADNWVSYSAVDIYDVSTNSWSVAALTEALET